MKNNNNKHEKNQMFQKFDKIAVINELYNLKRKNLYKRYIIDISLILSFAMFLFFLTLIIL